MEKAFVLISCNIGEEQSVFSKLKEIPENVDCLITYGDYDIVAEFATKDSSSMERVITYLRKLDKIRSTITLRVMGKSF